jgi:hypothetical protein
MYQSFTIKNFRCFRELTLSSLERVNLITGQNNVGKTTLLESIFLHVGANNPSLPLRVNIIRGVEQFAIEPTDLWGWLFYDRLIDERIELTSLDEQNVSRSLQLKLVEPDTTQLASPSNGGNGHPSTPGSLTTITGSRELILDYQDTTDQRATSRAFITVDGQISIQRAQLSPIPFGIYLSARSRILKEDAERYSNLERIGRQAEVLPALQHLEPRLRRLAVLVTGGVSLINGDIGLRELVPLPFMGEGLVRLLSILLAITNSPKGVVLIDEIENGLHYSVLEKVWTAIANMARQYETQIIATTHSWECIRAAHEAFAASGTYDFRLHRLDRIGKEVRAVNFDQKRLAVAEASDLEVR